MSSDNEQDKQQGRDANEPRIAHCLARNKKMFEDQSHRQRDHGPSIESQNAGSLRVSQAVNRVYQRFCSQAVNKGSSSTENERDEE